MRSNPIPVIAAVLLMSFSLSAQDNSRYNLLLRSGSFIPEKNIEVEKIDQFNNAASRSAGKTFAVIQFENIPGPSQRTLLAQQGIELLDYIPNNAYTVSISGALTVELLRQVSARAVIGLSPLQKMQPELAIKKYPSWAIRSAGTIELWISFARTYSFDWVQQELRRQNFEIVSTLYKNYRIIVLRVPLNRVEELAGNSFIEFVQPAPAKDKALNYNSMFSSRANVLKAPVAFGGNDLNGQGVVVGIGEDGDIQTHLDFTGRLINRAGEAPKAHGTHVAGTVGGAGIIQELYAGYANKATLIGQIFSNIYTYAPAYVTDYGMVITNNSYGSVTDDCAYNGLYDLTSRVLDQQAFDLPELTNVFAAGNDGSKTCSPYPSGFKNVLGGYQSAKNVIVVGSTDYKNDWSGFSSKGPVRDGRLKPEIMAMGEFVASTWVNNLYSYNNGTSMACPGVSGGLTLLIQRYRQLNAGANPSNGLLKAIACNGASDRGNTGPDFSYGFGSVNLLRSVKMIENATYFNSSITQGNTNTHTINVPANTAKLKVMLYWQDPPAAVMASKTLVNDLDLEVTGPGGTVLPLKLDTLSSNVNNPATTGADHINNIEQVVIDNPASGSYDLKSIGTTIAQGPSQSYHLVYDIIPQSFVLTNPVGGERLTPTGTYFFGVQVFDTMYVQWDDYSLPANEMYTVEFSSDNGSSWTVLSNSIPATDRYYKWVVPNTPTEQARIRLSKNNTAFTQTSSAFTITALAVVTLDATQCEGYIKINWAAIPGATDYEVMMLQGDEMVSVATTTSLTYTFSGLSKDEVYWVTVRPRINGNPGRRANAISRQPNSGSCTGSISDNDLKVDSIISPSSSGREFTSTALSNSVPITVRIRNLDDAVSSGDITISYSINGGTPVSEIIITPTADIAAGGFIDHTFATNADLSTVGTYSIEVIATKASDPVTINNSLTKVFKQLDNQPITDAELPWLDNLESTADQTVTINQMGLTGSDRYDFVKSTVYGRSRTFLNTGNAYSGTKALTLDMSLYQMTGNIDSLTGTFNLGAFNTTTDDIRLDFRFKNHNQKSNAANRVWIRGSDADSWIQVYDLFANQNEADGSYKLSSSLQLADSLVAHGQSFSSSFQVRWGQWGQYMAADNDGGAGYSFDDIRIYRAVDDIQLISIDTPTTIACNLNNAVPVKVTVRNTSDATVNNIPVVLRVDGIIAATESIPSIAANSSLQYTFSPGTADLSGPGNHTVEVWVAYATDNVNDNDTARVTAKSLPLVSTFPYLEDFESGDGTWYTTTAGNSTWEYGTPLSAKINRAASGIMAWKTHKTGYYNDNEFSYLYSPCFNLSAMTNPTLSFSLALDIEDCGGTLCDAAWMEYSTDGGQTWTKLGAFGQGTNWYNKNYAGNHVWSQQDFTRWHVATTALPTSNNSNLRLRFVFNSDPGVSKDGIAVDDIHIYDNLYGIYDVTGTSPVVNQTLSGSAWIDFIESGTNKLIASVNPNGQSMGSTDVQSYVNTGAVRINSDQFYHDRNITIKPTTVNLADSATVRFYFLDSETEALINATGCSYCYKPTMAYNLGVTKYSDADDSKENGTLADNTPGNYIFIPTTKIRMVPFDKGYYAEYKVKDFSEFWLNNGGFDNNTPLPVQLLSFTAKKTNLSKDVLLEWKTTDEINVNRFEIELAKGNNGLQQNQFTSIGSVTSSGNATQENYYQFTDIETSKSGIRYYRLKIIDNDGSFKYSAVRPVLFDNEIHWQVNPNPSPGMFGLVFQAPSGQTVNLRVYDLAGRLVKQQQLIANGFVQKINIDLESDQYANGLYLLHADDGFTQQSFRLIKQ
ncbi:MAG TPA: S8 family serine peptidase [Chitinophagaceae bacterium]|nr:S8 family serine peptidase [Chitinophagaceae bacterium]